MSAFGLPDCSEPSFGRRLREEQFSHHASDVIRLNNGSFGACPTDVLKVQRAIQDEWNSNPDDFWHSLGRRFEETRGAVARRLLRARPEDVFIVDNLTTAMATLAHSLVATISEPKSVVLLANHTYNAVHLAVRRCCALAESKHGISIEIVTVDIPFPILGEDAEEVIVSSYRRALAAIPPHKVIRLAFVDHLTSVPAMRLPLHQLVPLLRAHGTLEVVVDAAHSPGLVDIPPFLEGLAAPDYYMANLHKWCMAPISAAFLWVAPSAPSRARLHHPIISHCCGKGFQQECAMLGTRDYSAMLAVPAALDFVDSRLGGLERLREHNAALCYAAAEMLATAWGTADRLPARGLCAGTAMVGCPAALGDTHEEGEKLRLALRAWQPAGSRAWGETGERGIPLPHEARGGIVIQKLTPVSGDRLYMRLSAAPYNYMAEFEVLRDAVLDIVAKWS